MEYLESSSAACLMAMWTAVCLELCLAQGHQMALRQERLSSTLLNCAGLKAGTTVITVITAQLRFRLSRTLAVPYYLYMVQLKFLRTA